MYRTLLWAQDQNALSYDERQDLREYVYSGSTGNKKNLGISSQEIVRKNVGFDPVNDQDFVQQILRTDYVTTNSGTPFLPNYDGKRVIGVAIAENTTDFIRSTGFAGDAAPVPALVRVRWTGELF
ncbi:MAG: hypothetical protein EON55_19980 [Alphaproteobacteria bacterium]|nr:MAG: hypothetical protein EON55_19980 [Alphaproteobacteria bacterium]